MQEVIYTDVIIAEKMHQLRISSSCLFCGGVIIISRKALLKFLRETQLV